MEKTTMNGGRSMQMQFCFKIILLLRFFFHVSEIHAHAQRFAVINNETSSAAAELKLHVTDKHVELDNGIVKVLLLNPSGMIKSIGYRQIKNVLESRLEQTRRGYWDMVWDRAGTSHYDALICTRFKVVAKSKDKIEVSFTKTWNVSYRNNLLPLNIDKRYIIRRGVSGFYSYAILEHLQGWPHLNVGEARIVFKLNQNMFRYMAISDNKQRVMPSDRDRKTGRILNFKEAVLLTHTGNPKLKGEVDDKYEYSCDNKDNHVHGWISSNPDVGFWVITPSDEFRGGGPAKQDLTSHASSTSLVMFFSGHYVDRPAGVRLQNGEPWNKVLGPIFIYLNSGSGSGSRNIQRDLWHDAKRQMLEETKQWPYDFPVSKDFARANQRGSVTGRLLVRDRYIGIGNMAAKSGYVGLALPGDVGSWQFDSKGYQFWTQTDEAGHFTIPNVRAGTYNLYAWVPFIIGDFKHEPHIVIEPGTVVGLGDIVYYPPRNGPTLWKIGIPDRTAAEFHVPDPPPGLVNKLFINHTEKYRQYGLWERYTDLYPKQDLIYTVGESNYRKHWFFAHVNRRVGKDYRPTTWQIVFHARNVINRETYTLRIALASAHYANLQVWINGNPNGNLPEFETGRIGKDNAIARHGIHGQYRLYSFLVGGFLLKDGRNTIHLKQSQGSCLFCGLLYDYIRLEAPPIYYTI